VRASEKVDVVGLVSFLGSLADLISNLNSTRRDVGGRRASDQAAGHAAPRYEEDYADEN
jgi:hypothetical protein